MNILNHINESISKNSEKITIYKNTDEIKTKKYLNNKPYLKKYYGNIIKEIINTIDNNNITAEMNVLISTMVKVLIKYGIINDYEEEYFINKFIDNEYNKHDDEDMLNDEFEIFTNSGYIYYLNLLNFFKEKNLYKYFKYNKNNKKLSKHDVKKMLLNDELIFDKQIKGLLEFSTLNKKLLEQNNKYKKLFDKIIGGNNVSIEDDIPESAYTNTLKKSNNIVVIENKINNFNLLPNNTKNNLLKTTNNIYSLNNINQSSNIPSTYKISQLKAQISNLKNDIKNMSNYKTNNLDIDNINKYIKNKLYDYNNIFCRIISQLKTKIIDKLDNYNKITNTIISTYTENHDYIDIKILNLKNLVTFLKTQLKSKPLIANNSQTEKIKLLEEQVNLSKTQMELYCDNNENLRKKIKQYEEELLKYNKIESENEEESVIIKDDFSNAIISEKESLIEEESGNMRLSQKYNKKESSAKKSKKDNPNNTSDNWKNLSIYLLKIISDLKDLANKKGTSESNKISKLKNYFNLIFANELIDFSTPDKVSKIQNNSSFSHIKNDFINKQPDNNKLETNNYNNILLKLKEENDELKDTINENEQKIVFLTHENDNMTIRIKYLEEENKLALSENRQYESKLKILTNNNDSISKLKYNEDVIKDKLKKMKGNEELFIKEISLLSEENKLLKSKIKKLISKTIPTDTGKKKISSENPNSERVEYYKKMNRELKHNQTNLLEEIQSLKEKINKTNKKGIKSAANTSKKVVEKLKTKGSNNQKYQTITKLFSNFSKETNKYSRR